MRTSGGSSARNQAGLVGRLIVGWLVLVLVLGIAAIDGASIAFTTFQLSEIAVAAATDASAGYHRHGEIRRACEAAGRTVAERDAEARLLRCDVSSGGRLTVTVRKTASTFVVDRFSILRKYGRVTRTESLDTG